MNESHTWNIAAERNLAQSLIAEAKWKPILGGYNAVCAYPFQWEKQSRQAGEDVVEYRTRVEAIWTEAASTAAKHCNPNDIPKEWVHAWRLIHKYSMGKNEPELPPAA